jgi:hypothetical protein
MFVKITPVKLGEIHEEFEGIKTRALKNPQL